MDEELRKMPKLLILYYSRTGNTEKMAKAVAEGAKTVSNVDIELKYYAKAEELTEADAIILGTPTYHHDTTSDIKNLLEEVAVRGINLKDKIGATFGSYGWSGEAPDLLLEIMRNRFRMKTIEPSLRIRYTPDEKGLEECRNLGKKVGEKIAKPR